MAKYWSKYCQPQFADRIFTPFLENELNQPQGLFILLLLLLLLLLRRFYTPYVEIINVIVLLKQKNLTGHMYMCNHFRT